jgi:hypothetical protein
MPEGSSFYVYVPLTEGVPGSCMLIICTYLQVERCLQVELRLNNEFCVYSLYVHLSL